MLTDSMTAIERLLAQSIEEARAQGFYEGYRNGWCGGAEAQRRYIMQGDPTVPAGDYANPFEEGEPESAAQSAVEHRYPSVDIQRGMLRVA